MTYDSPLKSKLKVDNIDSETLLKEVLILENSIRNCALCKKKLSLWESYSMGEDYIYCSACKEKYRLEREKLAVEERHKEMIEGKSFILISRSSSISMSVSPIKIVIENNIFNKSYEAQLSMGDYKEIFVDNHSQYILKAYLSSYDNAEELQLHINRGESVYIKIQAIAVNSSPHSSSMVPRERIIFRIVKRELAKNGIVHSLSSC